MSGDGVQSGATSPGSSSSDRRSKLMQRTRVGALLAAGVVALLYAASLEPGALITLGFAVVLSLWSLVEVRTMGLFMSPVGFALSGATTLFVAAVMVMAAKAQDGRYMTPPPASELDLEAFLVVSVLSIIGAGLLLAVTVRHARAGTKPPAKVVPTSLIVLTVAVPLLALYPIRALGGASGLAAFIALAKVGDIAGYYVGSLVGKRRPFPSISPGKSVAGCNASLLTAMAVGALFTATGVLSAPRYGILSGLILGAVVNVTAQAGDLVESAYKRRAGFKDSGSTFGPSGGMFDLVDSLILSSPLAAVLWPVLFLV